MSPASETLARGVGQFCRIALLVPFRKRDTGAADLWVAAAAAASMMGIGEVEMGHTKQRWNGLWDRGVERGSRCSYNNCVSGDSEAVAVHCTQHTLHVCMRACTSHDHLAYHRTD